MHCRLFWKFAKNRCDALQLQSPWPLRGNSTNTLTRGSNCTQQRPISTEWAHPICVSGGGGLRRGLVAIGRNMDHKRGGPHLQNRLPTARDIEIGLGKQIKVIKCPQWTP